MNEILSNLKKKNLKNIQKNNFFEKYIYYFMNFSNIFIKFLLFYLINKWICIQNFHISFVLEVKKWKIVTVLFMIFFILLLPKQFWEAMPNRQVNAWIKLCLFIIYEILFNFFKKISKNYTKIFRLLKSISHTRLPGILWRTLLVLGQFCMYFQGPRNDFYLGGPNKKKNDIFRNFEIFTL